MDGHTSPRLGVRFAFKPLELRVYRPDGTPFLSFADLEGERALARQQAEVERLRADAERARADAAEAAGEAHRLRALLVQSEADRLRALLRAAGIDPDAAPPG